MITMPVISGEEPNSMREWLRPSLLKIYGSLLVFFVLLGGWLFVDLHQGYERVLADTSQRVMQRSQIISQSLRSQILSADYVLRDVLGHIQPADLVYPDPDPDHVRRMTLLLKEKADTVPDFFSMVLYNRDCVFTATPDGKNMGVRSAPELCEARRVHTGPGPLTNYVTGAKTVSGQSVIVLSRHLRSPAGDFLGGVLGVIELRVAQHWFESLDLDPSESVALLDDTQTLIARHPAATEAVEKQVNAPEISVAFRSVASEGRAATQLDIDGRERLFGFSRVDGFPFVVAYGRDKARVVKEWRRRAVELAAGYAALLLLALLVARFLWTTLRQREELRDSRHFIQVILDSVPNEIVVVDQSGVIVAANQSWRRLAGERGPIRGIWSPNTDIGANFLESCDAAPGNSSTNGFDARAAREGIQLVMEARLPGFSMPYACDLPEGRRWYVMNVAPMGPLKQGAVIVQSDVTEIIRLEERLLLARNFSDQLIESANVIVLGLDSTGNVIIFNRKGEEVSGYAKGELMGTNWFGKMLPPDISAAAYDAFRSDIAAGEARRTMTSAIRTRSGEQRTISWWNKFMLSPQGERVSVSMGIDVSEQLMADAKLRSSEEHFRMLAEKMADIVWRADAAMRLTYVNGADQIMRGFTREEVIGTMFRDNLTPQGQQMLEEELRRYHDVEASGGSGAALNYELPMRHKNGGEVWVEISSVPIHGIDGQVSGFQGIGRDVSGRRRHEAELLQSRQQLETQLQEVGREKSALQELASQDPLTGLYNRRFLDTAIAHELSRSRRDGKPVAVIMLDLDHFKKVNDQYGHAAGDVVIKTMADLLRKGVRESDLICRYGGEEFVAVMPNMSAVQALKRVEVWRRQLEELCIVAGDARIHVTVSGGIAVFPDHGSTGEMLLSRADEMLYKSKQEGRNRVSVYGAG